MSSIEDLLLDRAAAMAAHDGAPASGVYVIGAANALQADLLAARDRLVATAGTAHRDEPPAETPSDSAPEPEVALEEPAKPKRTPARRSDAEGAAE